MNGTSKSFKLNKNDIWSIILMGLLVGLASFLTYLLENIGHLNLGESTVFIVPIISVVITSIIRWIKDYTKQNITGEKQ